MRLVPRTIIAVADHSWGTYSGSGIYLSSDGGNSWTQVIAPTNYWGSAVCSADGKTLASASSAVYVSTNSGATWNPGVMPIASYFGLACSANGKTMISGSLTAGGIFVSTNSGATWTVAGPTNWEFFGVACSANGETMAAAAAHGGPIYRSTDSGVTWTAMEAPLTNWYAMAGSADGDTLVAATMNNYLGLVYTFQATPAPVLNTDCSGQDLVLSWTLPSRKFVLQGNPDADTTNWVDVPLAPALNYATLQNEVRISSATGRMFYRLIGR